MTENAPSVAEIRSWLLDKLRRELGAGTQLDASVPLADYGLESRAAIGVTADLEDWLGIDVDPTMFFDYPTVDELARFIRGELGDPD